MKKKKTAVKVIVAVLAALLLLTAGAFVRLHIKTEKIKDDISSVYEDEKYAVPVYASGVEVITQDVSCGYAVIEMFSAWDGGSITEESLYDTYGKVVTSTGDSFSREMNRQFDGYTTSIRKYLSNTEFLDEVYESLSSGIPVPFEWAALYEGTWTLHYSLITGLDVPGDTITVANPYGYMEELSLSEFFDRTSFEAYEDMPLFLQFGFAFGIFEKNTLFVVEPA